MCWSQLFQLQQTNLPPYQTITLLLVFSCIIVYDININKFLCKWKIKLSKYEIKPKNKIVQNLCMNMYFNFKNHIEGEDGHCNSIYEVYVW